MSGVGEQVGVLGMNGVGSLKDSSFWVFAYDTIECFELVIGRL